MPAFTVNAHCNVSLPVDTKKCETAKSRGHCYIMRGWTGVFTETGRTHGAVVTETGRTHGAVVTERGRTHGAVVWQFFRHGNKPRVLNT